MKEFKSLKPEAFKAARKLFITHMERHPDPENHTDLTLIAILQIAWMDGATFALEQVLEDFSKEKKNETDARV
jgi:hypothetical protein